MISNFYTNHDDVQVDYHSIREQSKNLNTPIDALSIVKPIGLVVDEEWGGGE